MLSYKTFNRPQTWNSPRKQSTQFWAVVKSPVINVTWTTEGKEQAPMAPICLLRAAFGGGGRRKNRGRAAVDSLHECPDSLGIGRASFCTCQLLPGGRLHNK